MRNSRPKNTLSRCASSGPWGRSARPRGSWGGVPVLLGRDAGWHKNALPAKQNLLTSGNAGDMWRLNTIRDLSLSVLLVARLQYLGRLTSPLY